jgi:hypothetical protein
MKTEDHALLGRLRTMWDRTDPPPSDLAERVLFTLQLENVEFELLRLQDVLEPVGARGHETARTVTFGSESLTIMVTMSGPGGPPRRVDGWIAPAAALRVELRTTRGTQETTADDDGRFAFTEVPTGLIQLVLHPTSGADVSLARPVVTPAVQL